MPQVTPGLGAASIPTFGGWPEELHVWLQRINLLADQYHWQADEEARVMLTHLEGPVYSAVSSLLSPPDRFNPWVI